MTLKAEDFVVEGLTADEQAALAEGAADDAAVIADDVAKAKPDGEGAGAATDDAAKAAADKVAADAKAAADKEASDKAAADKAAADAKAKADADAAAGAKPAGEGEDGAKPDAAAKPEAVTRDTAQPRQAIPDWQAPADADAKLSEINKQRDALAEKFDAGEITAKDLFAKQRELDGQARQIERNVERAQMATEMVQAVWLKTTVPAFLDANAHYRDNASLHGMLDTEVRRLQVEAAKKGEDPLDPSILTKADAAIKASLSSLGVKPAAGEKPAGEGGKQPAAKIDPKTGKPEIPPTLAGVPATEINGTDSQWATLDRLANDNPVAYEEAYGKLTDAQRDAYLARP